MRFGSWNLAPARISSRMMASLFSKAGIRSTKRPDSAIPNPPSFAMWHIVWTALLMVRRTVGRATARRREVCEPRAAWPGEVRPLLALRPAPCESPAGRVPRGSIEQAAGTIKRAEGVKPKPPMFPTLLSGTAAQQYMHRARMFRAAANSLVDYSNGEQNLPRYALLTHAIELSLKAFALHSVATGKPYSRRSHHDLRGWYELALEYGLPNDPNIAENINQLHDLHKDHYTRYPREHEPETPVPDLSVITSETADHLIDRLLTPIINSR
jgi:hypothetical protein